MRLDKLGDEAEQVFRDVWPEPFVEWGLRRPPFKIGGLSEFTRKAPDFLTAKGYVEVKGCGEHGVKLKETTLNVLYEHEAHDPVRIFVWDSFRKRWSCATLAAVTEVIINDGVLGQFHDGPTYTAVDVRDWPAEWRDHVVQL